MIHVECIIVYGVRLKYRIVALYKVEQRRARPIACFCEGRDNPEVYALINSEHRQVVRGVLRETISAHGTDLLPSTYLLLFPASLNLLDIQIEVYLTILEGDQNEAKSLRLALTFLRSVVAKRHIDNICGVSSLTSL